MRRAIFLTVLAVGAFLVSASASALPGALGQNAPKVLRQEKPPLRLELLSLLAAVPVSLLATLLPLWRPAVLSKLAVATPNSE